MFSCNIFHDIYSVPWKSKICGLRLCLAFLIMLLRNHIFFFFFYLVKLSYFSFNFTNWMAQDSDICITNSPCYPLSNYCKKQNAFFFPFFFWLFDFLTFCFVHDIFAAIFKYRKISFEPSLASFVVRYTCYVDRRSFDCYKGLLSRLLKWTGFWAFKKV
jgi:hypothetical protein